MTIIRLILLVAVLGGLMLLLAQNWSPAIPLVFLGSRTQPLSLAVWMLLSTAAGALTSLLISSLVQLSSRGNRQQPQPSYKPSDSPRFNKRTPKEKPPQEKEFKQRISTPPPASPQPSNVEDTYDDDWDLDRNVNDDWDSQEREYFEEKEYIPNNPRSNYTKIQDDRDYEEFPESVNDYDSAAGDYTYDKSDLKDDSRDEKTESVYDADYRVIVPPISEPTTPKTSENLDNTEKDKDDDDWDFLEDDFSEDKPPR
ncbi:MAG: LapA family protein [Cyanobacteria bacterium P01_C01_bin.38]